LLVGEVGAGSKTFEKEAAYLVCLQQLESRMLGLLELVAKMPLEQPAAARLLGEQEPVVMRPVTLVLLEQGMKLPAQALQLLAVIVLVIGKSW
jgi:hypothetical protein